MSSSSLPSLQEGVGPLKQSGGVEAEAEAEVPGEGVRREQIESPSPAHAHAHAHAHAYIDDGEPGLSGHTVEPCAVLGLEPEVSIAAQTGASPLPRSTEKKEAKEKEWIGTTDIAPSSPSPTSKTEEITKENPKIARLRSQNSVLQAQLDAVESRKEELLSQLQNKNAPETVKSHIRLLHQYNEIRDIGSGLLGMIADNRGVRVGEVFEEFGVAGKD